CTAPVEACRLRHGHGVPPRPLLADGSRYGRGHPAIAASTHRIGDPCDLLLRVRYHFRRCVRRSGFGMATDPRAGPIATERCADSLASRKAPGPHRTRGFSLVRPIRPTMTVRTGDPHMVIVMTPDATQEDVDAIVSL